MQFRLPLPYIWHIYAFAVSGAGSLTIVSAGGLCHQGAPLHWTHTKEDRRKTSRHTHTAHARSACVVCAYVQGTCLRECTSVCVMQRCAECACVRANACVCTGVCTRRSYTRCVCVCVRVCVCVCVCMRVYAHSQSADRIALSHTSSTCSTDQTYAAIRRRTLVQACAGVCVRRCVCVRARVCMHVQESMQLT
jgi:hypothetical protein